MFLRSIFCKFFQKIEFFFQKACQERNKITQTILKNDTLFLCVGEGGGVQESNTKFHI